jgi:hypothetical protein
MLEMALCWVLLFPALLSSQRPQTGRLSVTSTPPGAEITIDNQRTNQSTPFTFVVSPGEHRVAVTSETLRNCAKPVPVPVSPGSAVSIHCTSMGWDKPISK